MSEIPLDKVIQLVANFGMAGIVLLIWWVGQRDIQRLMSQYHDDMIEQRQMYANNAELCKRYLQLAEDQRDVIVMNTQAMTRLVSSIDGNQYCPMIRLEKRAKGAQG